jgi:type II secretory ATPase GspE/PulE/Tfp pilus assembly ATPase PilB-like protein
VVDALARAGGVQAAAARLLGVTERSVWHLVKKHRIEVSRLKQRVGGSEDRVLPRTRLRDVRRHRLSGPQGAFEVLVVDATINPLIRERSDAHQIRQAPVAAGMHTLLADALAKAIAGQTTIEEVLRVAYE